MNAINKCITNCHIVVLVLNLSSDKRLLSYTITSFGLFSLFFLGLCALSFVFNFFTCSLLFFVLNCQQYFTKITMMMQNTIILATKPKIVHMLLKSPAAAPASHTILSWLNVLSLLQLQL